MIFRRRELISFMLRQKKSFPKNPLLAVPSFALPCSPLRFVEFNFSVYVKF